MFLSNHTDGRLENMLFNLLPKQTLKFNLFFFPSMLFTYLLQHYIFYAEAES